MVDSQILLISIKTKGVLESAQTGVRVEQLVHGPPWA